MIIDAEVLLAFLAFMLICTIVTIAAAATILAVSFGVHSLLVLIVESIGNLWGLK